MTSLTVYGGAFSAMPAVTTAAVATPFAQGIETTVTINQSAFTAVIEQRSIGISKTTVTVSASGTAPIRDDVDSTSVQDVNNFRQPPGLTPPSPTGDQPVVSNPDHSPRPWGNPPPFVSPGITDDQTGGWINSSNEGQGEEDTDDDDNDNNNNESGPSGPPPFMPSWLTDDQPNGWRDKPIHDTFSVVNDLDATPTSSEQIAKPVKTIVPFVSDDDRPHGSFPSPLLPPIITTAIPSAAPDRGPTNDAFYPQAQNAVETTSQNQVATAARHGVHGDWWQPPPNWSAHIQSSEPSEVVVTVIITETLSSTTTTGTMEITVRGSTTVEPPTLARVGHPMTTGSVTSSNQTESQTSGMNSPPLSLVNGGAASLLTTQGPGVVAAEAIAVLAGFYVCFM